MKLMEVAKFKSCSKNRMIKPEKPKVRKKTEKLKMLGKIK